VNFLLDPGGIEQADGQNLDRLEAELARGA